MDEKRFHTLRLLGITISYYRKARGYTQAQLAEEVNISRTHKMCIRDRSSASRTALYLVTPRSFAKIRKFSLPVRLG